jgi:hypothetical protein
MVTEWVVGIVVATTLVSSPTGASTALPLPSTTLPSGVTVIVGGAVVVVVVVPPPGGGVTSAAVGFLPQFTPNPTERVMITATRKHIARIVLHL